jgi:prenyltransferase beta subunit
VRGSADRALKWLSKHQRPDGSWAAGDPQYDIGVTALALRAFVLAGWTTDDTVVRSAVKYLMAAQDYEGCVGPRTGDRYLLNHILATHALCDAYGATGLVRS